MSARSTSAFARALCWARPLGVLPLVVVVGLLALPSGCTEKPVFGPTVADLQAVHVGVLLDGAPVRKVRRVPEGGKVKTEPDGRARLRLDDGTSFVIAGQSELGVKAGHVALDAGRLFAMAPEGARTEIALGDAVVLLAGSNAAIERAPGGGKAKVYASSGELTVRTGGKDVAVRTGESATIEGAAAKVAPERAFEDWTGGLAAPWGARGRPTRVVGELYGRLADKPEQDVGSPLTIRAQNVEVRIEGESAETVVKTTFFHAGDRPVDGDFRLALPDGAIVSGFAVGTGDSLTEGDLGIAAREPSEITSRHSLLEWAGEGWVRGSIPAITPGAVVQVAVRYVEWLPVEFALGGKQRVLQYRLPLAGDGPSPIVGEFAARIDASSIKPQAISAGMGATVEGPVVQLRRSDFRPAADLVVELNVVTQPAPARMAIAKAPARDDAGDFVLVRAEAPSVESADGVSLVLVVDTSASVDAGILDAEQAFVEALLGLLGPRDRLLVLRADDTVSPVGPAAIGAVDEARRKEILAALGKLAPAGATDLGRAIEAGADALDVESPTAMVVMVGDGWPTVGDLQAADVRARLARRSRPMPRLGAVAAGPAANRLGLAALTRGSGPILEIGDRLDASGAASALVADALAPSVAGVTLSLGPNIEQIYPLEPRTVRAGETITVVGRLRGPAPAQATLQWRDAKGPQERALPIARLPVVSARDVERRWAAARTEELALRSAGREAITDAALRASLLTPWTAWVVPLPADRIYFPTPLGTRVLDLACSADDTMNAWLQTSAPPVAAITDLGGLLVGPDGDDDDAVKESLRVAARRVLDEAIPSIRACRDSRAALRPDLSGKLQIAFELDGEGRATDVRVDGPVTVQDDGLFRCVSAVVVALPFPIMGIGGTVEVSHEVPLSPGRAPGRTKCSTTSTLPIPLRRGVWRERLESGTPLDVFRDAKRRCELASWAAQRALLEMVLDQTEGDSRIAIAQELDLAGETEAASFLRQEAIRRARDASELVALRRALLRYESFPAKAFERAYLDATGDERRLAIVRRYLMLAPHDIRLRRQLLRLLEAMGDKETLRQQVAVIRRDPFADASLLADGASALRRAGDEAEARRTFGEIVERAPRDPWARAYLADRLRAEGWHEQAAAVLAPLELWMAGEPAVALRTALSHEGAGRIDVATRILTRLTQTAGRSEREHLHELASDLGRAMLLAPRESVSDVARAELERRARELPRPIAGTVLLVRAEGRNDPLDIKLLRGDKEATEERGPQAEVPELGLYRFLLEAEDENAAVMRLVVPRELPPARSRSVLLVALVGRGAAEAPTLEQLRVELEPNGKPVKVAWRDGHWRTGD